MGVIWQTTFIHFFSVDKYSLTGLLLKYQRFRLQTVMLHVVYSREKNKNAYHKLQLFFLMSSQRLTSKCTLETGALINQGTSEAITNNDA